MEKNRNMSRLAVVVILLLAGSNLAAQLVSQIAGPLEPGLAATQNLQQVGLVGALMTAVVILWRTLQSERAATTVAIKTMTEALAHSSAANSELRHIIEESVAAKRELAMQIELLRAGLGKLPCSPELLPVG